ncbi:hypothetical protein OG920_21060 [Streptomyces europaeiscabiei]|uniref:hypothetical protein n=1 Tax=Streptomyces europaeiscabiei TaxID=146819 RepID=UPI0029B67ACF|nr:hypothetical protein [Streptomyces europaeiscabiei]MDX3635782.1 hypothetical protein [Streptomyces europaeiscabiei]MDX3653217.1 hypothetical protein [Streptomyces europaeiscabiei]
MSGKPEIPEIPEVPVKPVARVRRRGRTALLIAAAVVLGLVAGTCAGYLVQADREPTGLPPLSQPTLKQAEGKGPEPLSADQDFKVKTGGDLRELLLNKPRGAREVSLRADSDGWVDLAGYSGYYEKPAEAFADLVTAEFRRVAITGWATGTTDFVEVRLAQFHQEERLGAADYADGAYYWAENEPDTDSWPVPGTGDGMAYVHNTPDTKPGYLSLYTAEAYAWRGDVMMGIWITDTRPVSKKKIMDLAKRQMERL